MSIKVSIPTGKDVGTATGLYQWDYGQVLEIESLDIGSEVVEVHFACANMTEAIVRPCSFSNGVGTVVIPDQCLEQTTPVTAWVYRIETIYDAAGMVVSTEGRTIKTITLPITARTRPSIAREIPQVFSDKYTELISEINEAVDNLENGNITAAKAIDADNAGKSDYATAAGNAANANHAVASDRATKAIQDEEGNNIVETYGNFANAFVEDTLLGLARGVYYIEATPIEDVDYSNMLKIAGLVFFGASGESFDTGLSSTVVYSSGSVAYYRMCIENGSIRVNKFDGGTPIDVTEAYNIRYTRIK